MNTETTQGAEVYGRAIPPAPADFDLDDAAPASAAEVVADAKQEVSKTKAARAAKSKAHKDLTARQQVIATREEIESGVRSNGDIIIPFALKTKKQVPKMSGRGNNKTPVVKDGVPVMRTVDSAVNLHFSLSPSDVDMIQGLQEATVLLFTGPASHVVEQAKIQGREYVEGEVITLRDVFDWYHTTQYNEVLSSLYLRSYANVAVSAAAAAAAAICVLPEGIDQATQASYASATLDLYKERMRKVPNIAASAIADIVKMSDNLVSVVATGNPLAGRGKPKRPDWVKFKTNLSGYFNQMSKVFLAKKEEFATGATPEQEAGLSNLQKQVGTLDFLICAIDGQIAKIDEAAAKAAAREAKKKAKMEADLAATLTGGDSTFDDLMAAFDI